MKEPLKITRETLMYIEELWENDTDPIYSIIESFGNEEEELPKEIFDMVNHDTLDLYRVILKDLTFEVVDDYVKEPKVGVVYFGEVVGAGTVLFSLNPFTDILERFYIGTKEFYGDTAPIRFTPEFLQLKEASPEQTDRFEIAKSYHDKGREFGEIKEMDIVEVMDDFVFPHDRIKHSIHFLNSFEELGWARGCSSKIKLLASQGEIQKLITKPTFLHSVDQPK